MPTLNYKLVRHWQVYRAEIFDISLQPDVQGYYSYLYKWLKPYFIVYSRKEQLSKQKPKFMETNLWFFVIDLKTQVVQGGQIGYI